MTDPETNRRFDRLEAKIDKLTEVLTHIARIEEKLVGTDARLSATSSASMKVKRSSKKLLSK